MSDEPGVYYTCRPPRDFIEGLPLLLPLQIAINDLSKQIDRRETILSFVCLPHRSNLSFDHFALFVKRPAARGDNVLRYPPLHGRTFSQKKSSKMQTPEAELVAAAYVQMQMGKIDFAYSTLRGLAFERRDQLRRLRAAAFEDNYNRARWLNPLQLAERQHADEAAQALQEDFLSMLRLVQVGQFQPQQYFGWTREVDIFNALRDADRQRYVNENFDYTQREMQEDIMEEEILDAPLPEGRPPE